MTYGNTSRSSSSASVKGGCCCLLLLFSFLALLSLAIILVIVLAIKPKKPQFDLQQVTVQYINLAATNSFTSAIDSPSSAALSLVIRMIFTARNDNIAGIKYRDSTFSIMYRGIPLGRGIVPGFYQAAHSVKTVQTTVAVDRVNFLQADAADLLRDAASRLAAQKGNNNRTRYNRKCRVYKYKVTTSEARVTNDDADDRCFLLYIYIIYMSEAKDD